MLAVIAGDNVIIVEVLTGLFTDPYTVSPRSLVISISDIAGTLDIVRLVIVSEPDDVCNVNAFEVVAVAPGAIVIFDGSKPVVIVVTGLGIADEPLGTIPVL